MKSMKIPNDELGSRRVSSSKMLLKPAGRYFLLIGGKRVGYFVRTGGEDRLTKTLRDRDILIEMNKLRSC